MTAAENIIVIPIITMAIVPTTTLSCQKLTHYKPDFTYCLMVTNIIMNHGR